MNEIDHITEQVKQEDLNPSQAALLLEELSGWYSHYAQQMKRVQLLKPQKWLEIKNSGTPKKYSDQVTDIMWAATEDGQKEIALKWELDRCEKMMSGIKQRLYTDKAEMRNLNNQY